MKMKGLRTSKGTTTLALALAASLAALTVAGEQADESARALAIQRSAIAIGERLDAAKTQEEKDAAWAELVALPSIPGGYPMARDAAEESAVPAGDLTMTSNDANRVAGEFSQAGSSVTFESKLSRSRAVAVHVEVNGHPLDLKFNPTSDRVTTDGHGYALSAEDKKALMELVRHFERVKLGAGPAKRRTSHHDFLHRAVNLWSEAPVGHPLPTMEFPRPEKSDDVGTLGVGGGQSALSPNYVSHNGWGPHYTNHLTSTGPCEPTCVGRCGAGCSSGAGSYDYWCAAHDICCGAHGGCFDPMQVECGDEYQNAAPHFFGQYDYSDCSWYVTGYNAPRGVSQQYITADFFSPGGIGTNTWSLRSYNAAGCFAFAYSTSGAPWTWGETAVPCTFYDWYWYDMTPKLWVIRIRTIGTDGQTYYTNSGSWVR